MKSTLKNPICITIAVIALILGTIFSVIAIAVIPNLPMDAVGEETTFNLEDLFDVGNLGSGNLGGDFGDLFSGGNLDLSGDIGLSNDGAAGSGGDFVAYQIYALKNENVYLKVKSFGDYTGKAWKDATPYHSTISYKGNQYSADYLTGLYLAENTNDQSYLEIKQYTGQYAIPYYISTTSQGDYRIQTNDVCMDGDAPSKYSVYFYSDDILFNQSNKQHGSVSTSFVARYNNYVKENYCYVGQETARYMRAVIAANGLDKNSDALTIKAVADYISNAATYDKEYDKALDSEENIAIAFLSKYKSGICQHYATAATLLFRTLGYPARYTLGYAATSEYGEWVDVTAEDAHAWVEVYIENKGWICVEVTGSSNIDQPEPEPTYKVELKPVSLEKKYDGTPLLPNGKVEGLSHFEEMGYTYEAVIIGEQTDAGKSTTTISAITIFDPKGNDVTADFGITYEKGTLHVYYDSIAILSGDLEKVYDGYPAQNDVSNFTILRGEIKEGYRLEIDFTANLTNVGSVPNSFIVNIVDENNVIANNEYKITRKYGTIKITPREVTFKAGDASKIYDGKPLLCDDIEITEGSLADTDHLSSYTINGSQTEIGRSENVIDINSIRIRFNDKDVTQNYTIHTEKGKLRVTLK